MCARTGLLLQSGSGRRVSRIAQSRFGALNPPQRPVQGPRDGWGRWDVPGHRTVYAAEDEVAAFSEVINYIEPRLPSIPMADLFDDVSAVDSETLDAQIYSELPTHGSMPVRSISKGWRDARSSYTLSLPAAGWFVDVTASASVAIIGQALESPLQKCGVDQLTLGEITGSLDKDVTTTIASWLHGAVLDDGSLPHGITYRSKWGAEWRTWAIWLREMDAGLESTEEPTKSLMQDSIGAHSRPLIEAAILRNMRVY
ncbi:RES domain-containing protein [Tomitella biformata]|uniref:RES domain-containing protein n=1 Tax=Tomitella biformata TaxID=630403 RepID=UPI0027DC1C1B|nr:RES domain-containing protein [Tomitella biformata]